MKTAIITVGLGFGDEGKGTVVDYLCKSMEADLVVRYSGGHQCGHNVVQPDGRHHCFNLYGSGAFHGVPTYLGENVIVDLPTLVKENDHLSNVLEVPQSGTDIYANGRALVCTPWFKVLNQAKERVNKHGSCGTGIGETRRYYLEHGRDSIFVNDLFSYGLLLDKLHLIKVRMIEEARKLGNLTPDCDLLTINEKKVADQMIQQAKNVNLRLAHSGLREFPDADMIVFEGAQGTLLDENFGFHPYTTWSTVTNRHAFEELDGLHYNTVSLGLTRTYMTRHGRGPFSADLSDEMKFYFSEPHNPTNEWQGKFRQGPLDIPMLEYAINCNYPIDGLFVTHMDKEPMLPYYIGAYGNNNQEYIGQKIDPCNMPYSRGVKLMDIKGDIKDALEDHLDLPILGTSSGPTHEDKVGSLELFRAAGREGAIF